MFTTVTKKSHDYLQAQIDELQATCNKNPAVAEMVKYILAYSDSMAYCGGDDDADIGREIIQMIWQITGMDLSSMGNSYHFSPDWVNNLNSFISNYIYDDSAFDFEVDRTIDFKPSRDDSGRWLQDPRIIVEAAKANRAYYKLSNGGDWVSLRDLKVDATKVLALVK